MTTRRVFIQAGAALSAAPALAVSRAALAAAPAGRVRLAVFDERFAAARAFAAEAARQGWPLAAIRGDITDLWFHDLSRRWAKDAAPVAGMTIGQSLFCLERLAWDAGLRVITRETHPNAGGLVSWVIARRRPA